jgi:small subunit ribosomal protein S21
MANQIQVKKKPGEDINKLLKRWKKKYEEFGIREELVNRQEFVKPSLQRRRQKQEAIRENQRIVEQQKLEDGQK